MMSLGSAFETESGKRSRVLIDEASFDCLIIFWVASLPAGSESNMMTRLRSAMRDL